MTADRAIEAYFATGSVTGVPGEASTLEERVAFARQHWAMPEFRKKAWPYCTAFVDASNVARWQQAASWSNDDKAKVRYLLACDAALRKLGYIPVMVSDANLVHLIDEPWTFQEKWGKYPHSVSEGRQADYVVLRGMRSLPESICVTRDRYAKATETNEWGDVLADRTRFYAYKFDEHGQITIFRGDEKLPGAARRLAAKLGAPPA